MSGTFQRRLRLLLIAASATITCWLGIPGTFIDKAAFASVARAGANPPFFISGNGSSEKPWKLRTFSSKPQADGRQAPVIVSLGDDVVNFFQTSPPSPIDLAVILTNFQRLGAKKAACSAVLAWNSPDPMGLAALDKAIAKFDSLVMTAPLSRGAIPEPMPPSFRRASIPLAKINGNPTALPLVNRIALPGVILGGDNSVAGFQVLDSELSSQSPPLLARWEDRVVLAFPLLVALQRIDVPIDKVEVRLGEYLKIGPTGPIVPIDRYGHLTQPLGKVSPYAIIPAESLIDASENLFPKNAPEPVILRDDRSMAEHSTLTFSSSLPAIIAALSSNNLLTSEEVYHRLPPQKELLYLLTIVCLLCIFCALPVFPRCIAFAGIATVCISAQVITAGSPMIWLPGIAALVATACAFAVSSWVPLTPSVLKEARVPTPPKEKPIKSTQEKPTKARKTTTLDKSKKTAKSSRHSNSTITKEELLGTTDKPTTPPPPQALVAPAMKTTPTKKARSRPKKRGK